MKHLKRSQHRFIPRVFSALLAVALLVAALPVVVLPAVTLSSGAVTYTGSDGLKININSGIYSNGDNSLEDSRLFEHRRVFDMLLGDIGRSYTYSAAYLLHGTHQSNDPLTMGALGNHPWNKNITYTYDPKEDSIQITPNGGYSFIDLTKIVPPPTDDGKNMVDYNLDGTFDDSVARALQIGGVKRTDGYEVTHVGICFRADSDVTLTAQLKGEYRLAIYKNDSKYEGYNALPGNYCQATLDGASVSGTGTGINDQIVTLWLEVPTAQFNTFADLKANIGTIFHCDQCSNSANEAASCNNAWAYKHSGDQTKYDKGYITGIELKISGGNQTIKLDSIIVGQQYPSSKAVVTHKAFGIQLEEASRRKHAAYKLKYDISSASNSIEDISDITTPIWYYEKRQLALSADYEKLTSNTEYKECKGWKLLDDAGTYVTSDNSGTSKTNFTIYSASGANGFKTTEYTAIPEWGNKTYTLSFNSDGGSTCAPLTYDYDAPPEMPANPTKAGYTFDGWIVETITGVNNAGSCGWTIGASYNGHTNHRYGNVTLKAKWSPNKYIIDYNGGLVYAPDGGTIVSPDYNKGYTTGGGGIELATAVKENYTFVGWRVTEVEYDDTSSPNFKDVWGMGTLYAPNQPVTNAPSNPKFGIPTLQAEWTKNSYVVYFTSEGTVKDNMNPITYGGVDASADAEKSLPLVSRDGYKFLGWKPVFSSGSWNADRIYEVGTTLETATGTVTLEAQWEPITYKVTYYDDSTEADGVLTPAGTANDIFYNIEAAAKDEAGTALATKIPTITKPGYNLVGWKVTTVDPAESSEWDTTLTYKPGDSLENFYGNVTLVPVWSKLEISYVGVKFDEEPDMINLGVDGDLSSKDAIQGCKALKTFGKTNPDSEYRFAGWYLDEACTQPVKRGWVARASTELVPKLDPASITEPITYYAKYAYHAYTLSVTNDISTKQDRDVTTLILTVDYRDFDMDPGYDVVMITGENYEDRYLSAEKVIINGEKKTPVTDVTIGNGNSLVNNETTEVIIPEGTTAIPDNAFAGFTKLERVLIPDTVTTIGNNAFNGCTNLVSVNIPDSVTSIGDNAFNGCQKLTNITIPYSVTTLGESAFAGCTALKTVLLPGHQGGGETLTGIPASVFSGCTALTHMVIPKGVTTIGEKAFNGCTGLTEVIIPEGVKTIGAQAFDGCCYLASVILPESLTSIGAFGFHNCDKLISITIPAAVTSIGANSFAECDYLEEVIIDGSDATVGERAFYNSNNLATVRFKGNRENWPKIGREGHYTVYCSDGAFVVEGKSLFTYELKNSEYTLIDAEIDPAQTAFELRMPAIIDGKKVTAIADGALQGVTQLKAVYISDNVKTIGANAFNGCSGLITVFIPYFTNDIGAGAFQGCTQLRSVSIPANVKNIKANTFAGCTELLYAEILGASTIEENAFSGCSKLETVKLPATLRTIKENAFKDCNDLKSIHYDGTESTWMDITDEKYILDDVYIVHFSNDIYTDKIVYLPNNPNVIAYDKQGNPEIRVFDD